MANSYAVAHTPQPHIGEAYVGIKCSISTKYRGAVPITEHQPADVLEPLRGTGWRGAPRPHKGTTLRPLRFNRSSVPLWGWGVCKTAPRFMLYPISWARRRHTGSYESLAHHADHLRQNLLNLREIVSIRMAIVKNRKKSSLSSTSAKIC